ncbi:MAG: hypothetical protein Q4G10_07975 [Bacteroidia bacterium]|nr:hypothetical protein [Bacteroidia bacterium]
MRTPKAIIELANKCGYSSADYLGMYGNAKVFEPVSEETESPIQPTGLPTLFLWENRKAKEVGGTETFDIYDSIIGDDEDEEGTNCNNEPILVNKKPDKCSQCGGKVVRILYGEPTAEAGKKAERKQLILGGCCISMDGDPQWGCVECGQKYWKK